MKVKIMAEWKINNWWMKTLFVLGAIAGVQILIIFIIGFIMGFLGL